VEAENLQVRDLPIPMSYPKVEEHVLSNVEEESPRNSSQAEGLLAEDRRKTPNIDDLQ